MDNEENEYVGIEPQPQPQPVRVDINPAPRQRARGGTTQTMDETRPQHPSFTNYHITQVRLQTL